MKKLKNLNKLQYEEIIMLINKKNNSSKNEYENKILMKIKIKIQQKI